MGKSIIGPITGFEKTGSKTGFQILMYDRDVERRFDAVEEAYSLRYSDAYFPYPCLGEILFKADFDDDGVLTRLTDCSGVTEPDCPIKTCFVMGTYRMFEVQITDSTPRARDILKIEDGRVVFTNFDRLYAEDEIKACVYTGSMPKPADGVSFKLAPDTAVYTWDWSKSLVPFSRCTRGEAEARRYVTRFSLGALQDVSKDCYWVGFYSTRGNNGECDLLKCFLNRAPGWE